MSKLYVVLGDQLDWRTPLLEDFDPAQDRIWMCECRAEGAFVWSHKARIAIFLAAMRHFAAHLRARELPLTYLKLDAHGHRSLKTALAASLRESRPRQVVMLEPGEWRLRRDFEALSGSSGIAFEFRPDPHFLCSREAFAEWMRDRKQPRMEHFYRLMRARTGWLMEDGAPRGGQWNFDHDNRVAFDAQGPGAVPAPHRFRPDPLVREVLELVEREFATHPGSLDHFDWPVTRPQALKALHDFIAHRLDAFGPFQDALWTGEPVLWHSRLSAALNLHLLDPREVCEAAITAHLDRRAPIASVEGFLRQILGWREYVRGLYWQRMPEALDENALGADQPLPWFYWDAQTEMNCLRETVGDTLAHGYAHHIQRLMVTGLFALLLGVHPREIHAWYLAIYVDAVEWAELPNVLGMSQYADGGFMASKPYVASGKYIQRMSNYCKGCRFDPAVATGETACPFTTLYWDFLDRHRKRFAAHPRLKMQVNNLARKPAAERKAIAAQAETLRGELAQSAKGRTAYGADYSDQTTT